MTIFSSSQFVRSALGKFAEWWEPYRAQLVPSDRMASAPRTLFVFRALDRLRLYRKFLHEILRELRNLFERIRVLRRNNLFRCGIGPLTSYADVPMQHLLPHIRARAHSQCIRRLLATRHRATDTDIQVLLEGWERGAEFLYKHMGNTCSGLPEQSKTNTRDLLDNHPVNHQGEDSLASQRKNNANEIIIRD